MNMKGVTPMERQRNSLRGQPLDEALVSAYSTLSNEDKATVLCFVEALRLEQEPRASRPPKDQQ